MIWHAFIWLPRSNNDINVVGRSPLKVNFLPGVASHVKFCMDEYNYHMCSFWQIEFTLIGQLSRKPFHSQLGRNRNGMPKCKKVGMNTWNMFLMCCGHDG
jgi:hypothetical protein